MLTISDEVLSATKMTASQLREEMAIYLFEKNKLSFGQARKLAGLDVLEFQAILFNHDISIHYGISDLEEDFISIKSFTK